MSNKYTPEQFVETWLSAVTRAENQEWIATQLDMTRQRVSQYAGYLRARGVELPKLSLNNRHLNESMVDKLNAKIKAADVSTANSEQAPKIKRKYRGR